VKTAPAGLQDGLEGFDRRLERAAKDVSAKDVRFAQLDASVKENGSKFQLAQGMEEAAERVRGLLLKCRSLNIECKQELEDLGGRKKRTADARERLPGVVKGEDEAGLKRIESLAAGTDKMFDTLEAKLRRFGADLKESEETLGAAKEKYASIKKKEEDARVLNEAFAVAQKTLRQVAGKVGLPGFGSKLQPGSSGEALRVEMTYFDESAELQEGGPADLDEDLLEKIPPFLTGAFEKCSNVVDVDFCVKGATLDADGHKVPSVARRFKVRRERWESLMTGEHRDTVDTLLSKIDVTGPGPAPPSMGMTGVIVLLVGFFLAMIITVIARLTMAR
jgi:hypothetical protein